MSAHALGLALPLAAGLPFAAMLLSLALLPLWTPRWWDSNRNKAIVAALCAVPASVQLIAGFGADGAQLVLHSARDYLSFLALIGALFVITSGIHLEGSLSGTPLMNTAFLALGGVLANLFGTTGASVLLIRPLLRANAPRQNKAHVVIFFIFVVANCGGLLTPLGDPPLFLGFLKGVPFAWTLQLWKPWLLVNGLLLVLFNFWDQAVFDREERERPGSQLEEVMRHEPLRVRGAHNLVFLFAIVAIVFASGSGWGNRGEAWPFGWQEGSMVAIACAAYASTSGENRVRNRFGFAPLLEVAVLFAGIFLTMAPALAILNARGSELGLEHPWHFFWASGSLSSFLDNAPTYLTFAATAAGIHGIAAEGRYLEQFLALGPAAARLLAAVSAGSVFMGANSYIGNGPNFVVKAIAEENGVVMPSFFGYLRYSIGILIPIFAIVSLVLL
ncbi:MAG TPA: sodium:proton antiporter [Myxococcota bacterium]|nr:sodium:proton antiporter [Myxococcota bacterium]